MNFRHLDDQVIRDSRYCWGDRVSYRAVDGGELLVGKIGLVPSWLQNDHADKQWHRCGPVIGGMNFYWIDPVGVVADDHEYGGAFVDEARILGVV